MKINVSLTIKIQKKMKEAKLRIHSFIDIITNSSTEIFIRATNNTIKNIQSLVNNLLSIANSNLKCEDIFIMSLSCDEDYDAEDYDADNTEINLKVNPIIDNENARIASKILSDLTGLFSITAEHNF